MFKALVQFINLFGMNLVMLCHNRNGLWVFGVFFFFCSFKKIRIFTLSVKTTLGTFWKLNLFYINVVAGILAEKTLERCRNAFLRVKRTTCHLLASKACLSVVYCTVLSWTGHTVLISFTAAELAPVQDEQQAVLRRFPA